MTLVQPEERIVREAIAELDVISDGAWNLSRTVPLADHGLSSLATVRLLLLLEKRFEVTVPDQWLNRESFESIGSISQLFATLKGSSPG